MSENVKNTKVQDNELTHMAEDWNVCDWVSLGGRITKGIGLGFFFIHLFCGENDMLTESFKTFIIGTLLDAGAQYVNARAKTGSHKEGMEALFKAATRL